MKDFLKTLLAVICGLLIMGFIGISMFMGMAGTLAGLTSSQPVLPKSGVLTIDMSKITIAEQASESAPLDMLQGNTTTSIGLWDAVQAIKAAAADPSVKYIYLKPENSTTGISIGEEIRKALANFRKSGKAVVAYVENPTAGNYYMASVADKIYMNANEGASPMITGVSSQLVFLKDILDKLGINMQLIRHGKYKSAGEMYIKNAPSAENMEQNQAMVNSLWKTISSTIAQSRGFSVEEFNSWVDNLELGSAKEMLEHNLVDEVVTNEELKASLATLASVQKPSELRYIPFADYVKVKALPNVKAQKKIAVIYADGEIIPGSAKQGVAGDRFASVVAKVRADSTVKAVVLRVSSPGGSVIAADKIKTELDLLKKDKPLIASYGYAAASGGYWISNNADKIFTDETTLTGSIGVFSMIPDVSGLQKDLLHVNMVSVKSNKHSDMLGLTRPLDNAETAYMQKQVEDIYTAFVNTVSQGRSMEPDYVDSIAQGRVWTGAEALGIHLVDEIGTLEDAINYAIITTGAETVDLKEWAIEGYPKQPTSMELLMDAFGMSTDPVEKAFVNTPFLDIYKAFRGIEFNGRNNVYARLPYEYIINF